MEIGIQQIIVYILFAWFFIFLLGKMQLNRIKKKLFYKIDEVSILMAKRWGEITLDQFYERVFADWDEMVRSSAKFVLSINELYPVSADPQKIKERMKLSPEWLGAFLQLRGTDLNMTESQREKVNEIVNLAPKR